LLRQPPWQQEPWLRQTNDGWAHDKAMQAKRQADIQKALARENVKATPPWYVNRQGQTMIVIPGPAEFVMGSPPTEAGRYADESQHRRRIDRTYALAAKPVTKEQFLRYLPKFRPVPMKRFPEPSCPIGCVVWYQAAAYCNWLSKQEDIPEDQWCYEIDGPEQVKLKANYLRLTGYRLPTEAEWEYACRAGAVTSRYYGESVELLKHYGWHFENSGERTWPVGSKKPNDWGLFDMHGNVWTWCQERIRNYPEKESMVCEDNEDVLSIDREEHRLLRGGSFGFRPEYVRCAVRLGNVPAYRADYFGLRPARTIR
jgi:formylglycine-generating enzyme required for sulfatase activity